MTTLFCCSSIQPYRPQQLLHQEKFTSFMNWAAFPTESAHDSASREDHFSTNPSFAIQLVRQVNYGPLESKRYFVPKPGQGAGFVEVSERELIEANFAKLNTYKNYKCEKDNRFFEVNVYQKDPVNAHHWRANVARPADQIDL